MYDKQAELTALRAKHAAELAKEEKRLDTESALLELLPELAQRPSIFVHSLYGSDASISYKAPHYASIDKFPAPTVDDIATLLGAAPPFPTFIVRDGSVGMQPLLSGSVRARAEITEVCPVRIAVWHECKVEWFGNLGGRLVSIHVELTQAVAYRTAHRVDFQGGYRYENRRTGWHEALTDCGAKSINYSAGSDTDIGNAVIYFDAGIAITDLLAALRRAMTVQVQS